MKDIDLSYEELKKKVQDYEELLGNYDYGLIYPVSWIDFAETFKSSQYKNAFSREGLLALYEHLETRAEEEQRYIPFNINNIYFAYSEDTQETFDKACKETPDYEENHLIAKLDNGHYLVIDQTGIVDPLI